MGELTESQTPPSSGDLVRYVIAAGETPGVEAKRPTTWDNSDESAKLTKDIFACANTADGGVIVVGRSEVASGKFELTGLSAGQAASFETTKVAKWVNAHCSPPVRLACARVSYESKEFIVIEVRPFDDIPVFCTKSYQSQSGKPLLSIGVYVRTANTESAPLQNAEEWRRLIGLATRRRANEFAAIVRALTQGQPLLDRQRESEPYADEVQRVNGVLRAQRGNETKEGGWRFQSQPADYVAERWTMEEAAKILVESGTRHGLVAMPRSTSDLRRVRDGWYYDPVGEEALAVLRYGSGVGVLAVPRRQEPLQEPVEPTSCGLGAWRVHPAWMEHRLCSRVSDSSSAPGSFL